MTHYLTKEKLEELQKKLKELQTTHRFEVAEKLKKAKEYGDLSENFEYADAKEAQESLEREILELGALLKDAEIISTTGKKDSVSVGHTVTLKNKKGDKITHTIVGSQEANPAEKKISNYSPVGKAILGKKVKDTVTVHTPKGDVEYQIMGIE